MSCQSGYKFSASGLGAVDFDDVFVRKEFFSEGGLWVWGNNGVANLGDNTVTCRSSPVQTVSGGTNWKQVSASVNHSAGVKTDGTLWTWGQNVTGQMGDNTIVSRSSPVQTVSTGTNWVKVAAGLAHTGGIKSDGSLWVWGGANYFGIGQYGQVGDNTIIGRSSPVQTISGGTNWKDICFGRTSSSAIKTDGTLWLWGLNLYGNLGDGTTIQRSSPVQTISGGTNWKQISIECRHAVAVKTDGTLWVWGTNALGHLGTNNLIDYSSPVQTVSGGTNWKQAAAGQDNGAGIKTDGTLWIWGSNATGQIGDNSVVSRSSPVQTVSGGTNWKQVGLLISVSAAIKTDGTLWTWGDGANGRLGDNSSVAKSSPVQTVSGGTNWVSLSTMNGVLAIREGCW